MKKILQDLSFEELENLIFSLGEKKFRAKQLYDGLTRGKKISGINIPSELRSKLLQEYEDEPVKIIKTLTSADGTEKYLFELSDGNVIEGVLMKYNYGNLTSGEILCQVLTVNALHAKAAGKRAVTNIVLMGSGEPLDNYANVVAFLKNVSAEGGINISPRNVSLSTCGLVPKIYGLADEGLPVNLTISLHQTTDEGRARTMPIAKKYSIAEILKACGYYFEKTGRRYIFEYSLIADENCDAEHAEGLVKLLKGKPCHVNLIRLNEVKERDLNTVTEKQAYRFLGLLEKGGLSATLRRSMGNDIGGACGQLRANHLKNN